MAASTVETGISTRPVSRPSAIEPRLGEMRFRPGRRNRAEMKHSISSSSPLAPPSPTSQLPAGGRQLLSSYSGQAHFFRARSLGPLALGEGDLLPLMQLLHGDADEGGLMKEDVLAGRSRDESETLVG